MDKKGRINIRVSEELQERIEKIKNETKVSYSDICRPILESALLEKDPGKSPPSLKSEKALEQLASAFHPTTESEIEYFCRKFDINQRRVLFNLLEAIANDMIQQGPNLEHTLELSVPLESYSLPVGRTTVVGVKRKKNLTDVPPPKEKKA